MRKLQLSDFDDADGIIEGLRGSGFSPQAAADKAELFAGSARGLVSAGVDEAARARAFFVPGRIEVLGKHTDYAGGRSLLAAADRGFAVVAAARGDQTCSVHAVAAKQHRQFQIGPDLKPVAGDWSNYPMTVARRIARNFPGKLVGADIAFGSDLPVAAGMSSSSAMMVATFLALAAVNKLHDRPEYTSNIHSDEQLAEYLGVIENGQTFGTLLGDKGVGTFGGSEDHTCMLCCRPGTLSQYSYCPVAFERAAALPDEYVFAVAASGVTAEKTGNAMARYNRMSDLAGQIARAWRDATGSDDPHIAAALASGPDAAERMRGLLDSQDLIRRFEHFLAESEQILPAAGDALAAGRMDEFGRLIDQSQAGAVQLLGNQIDETIFLANSARQCGAVAASAFGAGFGGSVWALVQVEQASRFVNDWSAGYGNAFSEPAANGAFFTSRPGPAAFEL